MILLKLKTIYINRFGKLKDFRLDLSPGLNVIYGSNEAGKTTVMNFVKMMFYGTSGKSGDIGKNMRKKYSPWDGTVMSGFIEFEHEGQNYRIEREFGSSNISDSVTVWNLSSGTKEPASCKYEPGERFMDISSSVFERSVFIGDVSAVVHGTDKDDEITVKLMNFSSTAEENVSYDLVKKRLKKAHEELRARGGKNGEIDKLLAGISEKTEQLSAAEENESLKRADEELYASFCEHLAKKKERSEKLSSQLREQHIIRELHSLEVQSRKNAVKEELRNRLDELTRSISNDGFTVTDAFLDECSEKLSRLGGLREVYAERKNAFNELSAEYSGLRLDEEIEAAEAAADELSDELALTEKQSSEITDEIERIMLLSDEIDDQIRETQIKEELWKEHLEDMEPNYAVLVIAALMIIIAVTFFLGNPWFLLSAIPVCGSVILGTKLIEKLAEIRDRKAGIEHRPPDYEKAYLEFDSKKEELKTKSDGLAVTQNELASKLRELETQKKEADMKFNSLKIKDTQYRDSIASLGNDLGKTGSSVSELEFQLTGFFSKYRKVSGVSEIPALIDEASDILSEIEKTKAVYASKTEEDLITDSPEKIAARTEQLKSRLSLLTADSGLKLLSDSQTDLLEEELEEAEQELAVLREKINDMRSELLVKYQDTEQPSVLKKELGEAGRKLADMAGYDRALLAASEVMEEAENEIRQTFAPELNSKTKKIFSHMTGGRYTEAIVSKDLSVTISENENLPLREWQYLSTGTSEQAYFSLRLALADMMGGNRIPVFIDDAFAHYDEERTRKGFLFLSEYSRLNQVIFFTCHRYGIISDQYTSFPENG